jgi:hypothetical protein
MVEQNICAAQDRGRREDINIGEGGVSSCFDQLFQELRGQKGGWGQKIFRTNISKASNIFRPNKQGFQLFQRKHDQSLEIVKIANDDQILPTLTFNFKQILVPF